MTTTPFKYWEPSDGERQLRIFISHRYGDDHALYEQVIADLDRNGFPVQNVSLPASELKKGPRGGRAPNLKVQAAVAARIYTADILIAPSRPAVTRSHWVTWEVQLAAVGYGIPILFVKGRDQQYNTKLVREVDELDVSYAVCEQTIEDISRNVAHLVSTRPDWGMRHDEPDPKVRFRGPPLSARNEVLTNLPLRSRYAPVQFTPPPPKRRWSLFGG